MSHALHAMADGVSLAFEFAGVAVIALGVLAVAARSLTAGARGTRWEDTFVRLRSGVGRAILLGLELLVAADIIATVTSPLTFERVGVLAVVVLIRTLLSFALEIEIEGRLPWRRNPPR